MKKIFTLVLLALCMGFGSLSAQVCTPDSAAVSGLIPFSPTPFTDLPTATLGVSYSATVSMYLTDSLTFDIPFAGTVTLPVNFQKVNDMTGLPAGLNWECAPANCQVAPGEYGCILISGTPTNAPDTASIIIDFSVNVEVDTATSDLTNNFIPVGPYDVGTSILEPLGMGAGYDMMVADPASVQDDLDASRFQVAQNVPNPTSGLTTIHFTSPKNSSVEFKVFNLLGTEVYSESISAASGLNSLELNTNKFNQGIYIYNLNNGDVSLSRRLVVTK